MEVRRLGLNARASCKPVRRQTPARPCGARRSPCRSRRRGTQANADIAGFVPSRSSSGSQVSVLGYAVLMPRHSTTSSRCGAVFLRHSNIRCRCLSWVKNGSGGASASLLLYPTKQTSTVATATSVSCQKPTSKSAAIVHGVSQFSTGAGFCSFDECEQCSSLRQNVAFGFSKTYLKSFGAMVVSMHSAVVELQKCQSNRRPSLQKWTSYAVARS